MRICYPTNDTPVFTYPSVSTSDYDWSRKSSGERFILRVLNAGLLAIVLYSFLVSFAHRLITWDDVTFSAGLQLLKCLGILALFPLIVFPVLMLFAKRDGRLQSGYPEHRFFGDWASVFRRPSKGGGRTPFFVEDVEDFNLQRTFFRQEPIYLAEVRFKRRWIFKRNAERFILRVSDEAGLQPFLSWAKANQSAVSFVQEEIHRPS